VYGFLTSGRAAALEKTLSRAPPGRGLRHLKRVKKREEKVTALSDPLTKGETNRRWQRPNKTALVEKRARKERRT
jgi:hypothetical protein